MRSVLTLMILCNFLCANAQSAGALLQKAEALYKQDQKAEAKVYYEKAALMNNADAHFNLAYKYALPGEERIYHYKQAALGGNGEAMSYFLEAVFFRQDDFFKSDPFLALEVYEAVQAKYPSLHFFDQEAKVQTLRYATEAGPFDARSFMKTFGVDTAILNEPYGVWKIAEAASRRKGVYSKVDNRLLLQLISRGGFVPAELIYAVKDAYKAWKENSAFEFNICDYVTSGYGMGYCAGNIAREKEKKIEQDIAVLARSLKNNAGQYLRPAYKAAAAFFESKVWNEEAHGGTGYAAFALQSLMEHKDHFMQEVRRFNQSGLPSGIRTIKDNDDQLNRVYKKVMATLKVKPVEGFNTSINAEGVQQTQRLWIRYRDAVVTLYTSLVPGISKQQWINWLTRERINELEHLMKN